MLVMFSNFEVDMLIFFFLFSYHSPFFATLLMHWLYPVVFLPRFWWLNFSYAWNIYHVPVCMWENSYSYEKKKKKRWFSERPFLHPHYFDSNWVMMMNYVWLRICIVFLLSFSLLVYFEHSNSNHVLNEEKKHTQTTKTYK